ncbi:hypothetical protein STRTUCAR8_03280 [Streptomyces turgidiscabies Car8]|uniref:Uncharacterized protein n=1 Tax=Streptomyces turgidiscabies (strain Car8) TaxID=698760 RepID=L7FD49_STRT8|nr:hypothetical protein STRTUCAR8_03280 [Streptomyces turgidiscabies Car8]
MRATRKTRTAPFGRPRGRRRAYDHTFAVSRPCMKKLRICYEHWKRM